jgi:uncharacterized damage-inducible protein DinB
MPQVPFIADQLKVAFEGEAWHGSALMEILDGVDAATATAHPIPAAHSIWELVLHLATWEFMPSDEENFPQVRQPTDSAWREAVQTLQKTHAELIRLLSGMKELRLNERVPGKDYDLRFMLTGVVQHAAYHGGQIALLKKAQK